MLTAHHTVAFLVLAATFGAAVAGGVAFYRRAEPRGVVTHLLALAATFVALRGHTGNAATSSGGSQAPASSGATQQQSGGLSGGTVTPAPQTVQPQVQTHTS